jgi:glycogen synthase
MPDLHALRRFRHVFDEVAFARSARRALRRIDRIDFVLCHSHSASHLAARPLGIPFGFFVHGDITDRPPGTYDPRLTAFYKWVTPRAYASAGVVFVLAPFFAGLAKQGGARQVVVIPNGIDPADIGLPPSAPPARARSGGPLRILYVGRLSVEKGIEYLLDACALLDVDYQLTIAGGGPLLPAVEGRAGQRTIILGKVPKEKLGGVYKEHDVFCTPSLSEPFALAILEALVSGLPVVGTQVGGIPDVVVHGVNGLLVPPRDPAALADALATLARDEALRSRLAAAAYRSVLPRLSWTHVGDAIAEVVRTVTA